MTIIAVFRPRTGVGVKKQSQFARQSANVAPSPESGGVWLGQTNNDGEPDKHVADPEVAFATSQWPGHELLNGSLPSLIGRVSRLRLGPR